MPKRPQKSQKSRTNMPELIVVTFAENAEQAKEYETLLESNGIPVTIKEQVEDEDSKGIAIMVPEDYLDEAHVVIESQDAYDDFYDFALEDEDEGEFDNELFDGDF
jgi:ribosome-interacting GTPase 1